MLKGTSFIYSFNVTQCLLLPTHFCDTESMLRVKEPLACNEQTAKPVRLTSVWTRRRSSASSVSNTSLVLPTNHRKQPLAFNSSSKRGLAMFRLFLPNSWFANCIKLLHSLFDFEHFSRKRQDLFTDFSG